MEAYCCLSRQIYRLLFSFSARRLLSIYSVPDMVLSPRKTVMSPVLEKLVISIIKISGSGEQPPDYTLSFLHSPVLSRYSTVLTEWVTRWTTLGEPPRSLKFRTSWTGML